MNEKKHFSLFVLIILLLSFPRHSSLQAPKYKLRLPQDETLNANLDVRSSDLVIAGELDGKIDLQDGSLRISGRITDNVSVTNGDIILDNNSYVEGDVLSINGSIQRNESSQVLGEVREVEPKVQLEEKTLDTIDVKTVFRRIFVSQCVAAIVLSPLLILTIILFFRRSVVIANAIQERPLRCFTTGLIGFSFRLFLLWSSVGLCFLHPVFTSRIFQRAYLLLVLLLLLPFLLTGISACLSIVGQKLLRIFALAHLAPSEKRKKHLITVILGLLFTVVVSFVPIVGWLFGTSLCFFGIGAALITALGSKQVIPKVQLREGERRKSIKNKFFSKTKMVVATLVLLMPPMLSLGYFFIYVFFPGIIGLAKPEYSVKEVYSLKQIDFAHLHFRFSMKNAYYIPFYLDEYKAGALILGEGEYLFSLVKETPVSSVGNIAETNLYRVYVLADSEGYFPQFEKDENLVTEKVETILRNTKQLLNETMLRTGLTRKVYGVRRKEKTVSKMNRLGLRLSGRNLGEAFMSRDASGKVIYHAISSGKPQIVISSQYVTSVGQKGGGMSKSR